MAIYFSFVILFIYFINSQTKCTLPNTEEGADKKCHCKPGFITDDNFNKKGCWKCSIKCHPFAICAFQDDCRCNEEFIGDGVTFCRRPIPIIQKLLQKQLLSNGETLLTIGYQDENIKGVQQFRAKKFFCQVDSLILKAKHFTRTELQCQIPKTIQGDTNLSISYDSYNWSKDQILVNLDNTGNMQEIIDALPFLTTLLVAMMFGILAFYGKSLFFTIPEEDQENLVPDEIDNDNEQ